MKLSKFDKFTFNSLINKAEAVGITVISAFLF